MGAVVNFQCVDASLVEVGLFVAWLEFRQSEVRRAFYRHVVTYTILTLALNPNILEKPRNILTAMHLLNSAYTEIFQKPHEVSRLQTTQ